jgi:hypothetical protein
LSNSPKNAKQEAFVAQIMVMALLSNQCCSPKFLLKQAALVIQIAVVAQKCLILQKVVKN